MYWLCTWYISSTYRDRDVLRQDLLLCSYKVHKAYVHGIYLVVLTGSELYYKGTCYSVLTRYVLGMYMVHTSTYGTVVTLSLQGKYLVHM